MPDDPMDELEVEGEEGVANEPEPEPEVEAEGTELAEEVEAPPPQAKWVPYERFEQANNELQQVKGLLTQLASQVQQPRSAPTEPSYDNPSEPEEWRNFRKAVRESVQPLLQTERQQVAQYLGQLTDAYEAEQVRQKFPDYAQYEGEVEQIRQEWLQRTGQRAPRDVAYRYVRDLHREREEEARRRRTTSKRVAAGSSPEAAGPAKVRAKAPASKLTAERISKMTDKEAAAELEKMGVKF